MGKLVFGMMQSLDGYVAGAAGGPQLPRPGDRLHRHFNDHVRALAGIVYGRRMYEVMRYWDDDQPDWDAVERDFAAAWRATPKWVVSHTLESVGPNAALVRDDAGAFVRRRLTGKRVSPLTPADASRPIVCHGSAASRALPSPAGHAAEAFRVRGSPPPAAAPGAAHSRQTVNRGRRVRVKRPRIVRAAESRLTNSARDGR